ncbi:uncharacterized protein LOC131182179 [Hevea brasiliensis]|uniref:uncharacterized protein LOC131182179 n=1 Tax=Hevea brasiliensis TaxID=3981 RepID=UPI0025EB1A8A|nr:uncharacterized protein LOC131182179 [Hevea brasiliensis]
MLKSLKDFKKWLEEIKLEFMEGNEGFGPFLKQMMQDWTQEAEDIGRFIENCDGRRAFAITNGLSPGREYNLPWIFLVFFSCVARYWFFFISKSALRDYIDNSISTNPPSMLIFQSICLGFALFDFLVVSYIESIGPIVDYHEIGRVGKTAIVLISSFAALIFRLLVQDIYHSYMLIIVTAELHAYFQLLYYSRDHGFWDVFFVASLQIIIINLNDGNIWIFIFAILLICKFISKKFRSYSLSSSQRSRNFYVISSCDPLHNSWP